jgi:hypothetical protein
MDKGGRATPWHWQRFVVDLLILTSTTAIALAAIGATPNVIMILLSAALIGVGLILDPIEPSAAQQAREHFDAALAEAASL